MKRGLPGSLSLAADDRSLEVHVCHSLTRELEVLQDHLLGLFADQSGLQPSHILVVTPDLEAAGPLIDAVFGTAPPSPEAEWRDVSLTQLVEFFRNPCRFLLRRRLGIDLQYDAEELLDEEPFLPDWPGRSALARRLLPVLLQGADGLGHTTSRVGRHRDAERRPGQPPAWSRTRIDESVRHSRA